MPEGADGGTGVSEHPWGKGSGCEATGPSRGLLISVLPKTESKVSLKSS